MIIDAHIHVFPDQSSGALGRSAAAQRAMMQSCVGDFWGRMVSSHQDRQFIPAASEDVQFEVGDFGRWQWKKNGKTCWLQRGSAMMTRMRHSPEQAIAAMDCAGVDYGIVQSDIEYVAASFGRTQYFRECIERWGNRLIGTVALDYNLSHDDAFLARERESMAVAIEHGFRGVYISGVGLPEPIDHPRCDPLWRDIERAGLPVYIQTGFCSKNRYLDQLHGLRNVIEHYVELNVIESHFGGNVVYPGHPGYTDIVADLHPLLETGRFFLELGYVLGFENFNLWGKDSIYPFPKHNDIVKAIYEDFGAQVLVWGSDVPWCYRVCTYQQIVDLIQHHTPFMNEEDRAAVLGGNLARLFQLRV